MKRAKKYPFLSLQRQRFCLNFENASTAANLPSERDFYRWAWAALKNEYRRADISLILLDEEEARAYNRDYRGKDYATNILSYASELPEAVVELLPALPLGELVICHAVVVSQAAEQGKTVAQHLTHLLVHGMLHLLGFDHELGQAEQDEMEAIEIAVLDKLSVANPYE